MAMIEVKQFVARAAIEVCEGDMNYPGAERYVLASDYEALAAESERMRAELSGAHEADQQPAAVQFLRFLLKHPTSGEVREVMLTREQVAEHMEEQLYEALGDQICHCEPVGETNVVDCNCDDYFLDFELVKDGGRPASA